MDYNRLLQLQSSLQLITRQSVAGNISDSFSKAAQKSNMLSRLISAKLQSLYDVYTPIIRDSRVQLVYTRFKIAHARKRYQKRYDNIL